MQVPSGDGSDSDTTRTRRVGRTKYCGVFRDRVEEPKKANRTEGKFHCIICGSRFTRVEGVNYHFPKCVRRHGNPNANNWYDHPTCRFTETAKKVAAAYLSQRAQEPPKKRIRLTLRMPKIPTPTPPPPPPPPKTKTPKPAEGSLVAVVKDKRKRDVGSREAAPASGSRFHLDESQPPLSTLPAIFHDMVLNAWNKTPLKEAMDVLSGKQVHIATMCSGTESPLLALDIIKEGKFRH